MDSDTEKNLENMLIDFELMLNGYIDGLKDITPPKEYSMRIKNNFWELKQAILQERTK